MNDDVLETVLQIQRDYSISPLAAELLLAAAVEGGFPSVMTMMRESVTDSVVPGICTRHVCMSVQDAEPDARRNYCESCERPTVRSVLVLAGLI